MKGQRCLTDAEEAQVIAELQLRRRLTLKAIALRRGIKVRAVVAIYERWRDKQMDAVTR